MLLVAWRNVWCHKLRSIFLAICVVVGVAFVAGTYVLTDTIKNVYSGIFNEAYKGVDLQVRARSELGLDAPRDPIPASLLPMVRSTPGVGSATGSVFAAGGSRILDKDGNGIGNAFAPTFLASWQGDDPSNSFQLVHGRQPSAADEVLLDSQAFDAGSFTLGDEVRIQTPAGLESFRLVGVVQFGRAGNMGGASTALFELPTAQRITNRVDQLDSIDVQAARGTTVATLRLNLERSLGSQLEVASNDQLNDEASSAMNEGFSFLSTFLLSFAVIALFVGAFIVYNTFSVVVFERTKELALLRALGAGANQILISIVLESLIVGLFASVAGLFAGLGLAFVLKTLLRALGFGMPSASVVVLPRTVMVSLLGGMLMTVVSAIAPGIRAARVAPLAAVRTMSARSFARRPERIIGGAVATAVGVGLVVRGSMQERFAALGLGAALTVLGIALLAPTLAAPTVHAIGWPMRRLRSISGQLAEENAARTPRRTATTASALMIGTALIAGSLVLASSISRSMNDIIDQGVRADFVVNTDGLTGIGNQTIATLRRDPDVAAVHALRLGMFKVGTATKEIAGEDPVGLDPSSTYQTFDLGVTAGRITDIAGDGIAIYRDVATAENLSIGDVLPVTLPSGTQRPVVKAIFDRYGYEYVVSLQTHAKWFPNATDDSALVLLRDGASVSAAKARLTNLVTSVQPLGRVMDREDLKSWVQQQLSQMLNLIYALVGLSVFIALLGVLITMLLSVFERTHELGLLRAIGMDRRDARSMIRKEAAIVSFFGAVMGVLLGTGLGVAFVKAMDGFGISALRFPVSTMIVLTVVITIAGVVASMFPAARAGRLNVLQAIATE
jgi:putative ABC transport system permease protein